MDGFNKLYFDYLTSLIDNSGKVFEYSYLLEYLYNCQFVWLSNIPLDENRAIDGMQLRTSYAKLLSPQDVGMFSEAVFNKPCSMLEMLVAFADRLTYVVSSLDRSNYFWLFIENLGLNVFSNISYDPITVNNIVQGFIYGKKVNPADANPPLLFPCREVYNNLDKDLYMQANYYLNCYLR